MNIQNLKKIKIKKKNVIKYKTYFFRLKKEINGTTIKDKIDCFRLEKNIIKDIVFSDIRNLSSHKVE